ncbi:hypothetical protein BJV78DRAFT_1287305 [Lactifluus subvellereus]|nr:hypothetical protein BJV78DRAFT_1287305 [Lactifluus subvellereus]
MSSTNDATAPFLNLQVILSAALANYSKQTGNYLENDPLAAEIGQFGTPDHILSIFEKQAQKFDEFGNGDSKLMKYLKPIVDGLHAFSTNAALSAGVSLAFPPAQIIFSGISVLLIGLCSPISTLPGIFPAALLVYPPGNSPITALNIAQPSLLSLQVLPDTLAVRRVCLRVAVPGSSLRAICSFPTLHPHAFVLLVIDDHDQHGDGRVTGVTQVQHHPSVPSTWAYHLDKDNTITTMPTYRDHQDRIHSVQPPVLSQLGI